MAHTHSAIRNIRIIDIMSESSIVKKLNLSSVISPLPVIDDDSLNNEQGRTPLSSRKASKLSAVIGDGSFEAVLEERAKVRFLRFVIHLYLMFVYCNMIFYPIGIPTYSDLSINYISSATERER